MIAEVSVIWATVLAADNSRLTNDIRGNRIAAVALHPCTLDWHGNRGSPTSHPAGLGSRLASDLSACYLYLLLVLTHASVEPEADAVQQPFSPPISLSHFQRCESSSCTSDVLVEPWQDQQRHGQP